MPAEPRRRRWHAGVVLIALAAASCGSGGDADRTVADSREGATTTVAAAPAAVSTTVRACEPAPLDLRAATVLVVGIGEGTSIDDPLVSEVAGLGLTGVTLRPPNIVDAVQLRALVEGLRQRSPRRLLIGVDEEGGRVSRLRSILGVSESARELGQLSPDEIADIAAERGAAIRDLGFDVNFAPVVDADGGPASGSIGDRSFASEPDDAGVMANSFADGLRRAGIVAIAKHFPGQGGLEDSHDGAVVSEATLESVRANAAGFRPVIESGIPAVMMSHVTFPAVGALPASLEPAAYSLLRSLGFDGVAVTDSMGMGAIVQQWPIPDATVMALAAGADLVLANQGDQATAMRDAVVAAVSDGRLSEDRLDEAVARVLTLRGEDPATMICAP
jgi:beta-N-acetylhexosaminidase